MDARRAYTPDTSGAPYHKPYPRRDSWTVPVGCTSHPEPKTAGDSVAILLGTYNGEAYLSDQIDSIAAQKHQNWSLWASDDDSSDQTPQILQRYQQNLDNPVHCLRGPAQGFATNFLSLVNHPSIEADYYSYCDQDDIWEANKVERAVRALKEIPAHKPAIYFSRTMLITADNTVIGPSTQFQRPPTFANALVQNIGAGNTMVFNRAARELLCEAGIPKVICHDWWSYMLVTGAGGEVIYDKATPVRYRQHVSNNIGANFSSFDKMRRFKKMMLGHYRKWNAANTQALTENKHLLTQRNRQTLEHFCHARNNRITSLMHLKKSGVYRQTTASNLALNLGLLIGRV
ncbi:glycosyltransferase family 2 protein [Gilvimarinus xylanilyticus]|uniref:Glycosyltransferase family 2 protein n=1 Tax=Gilvimarinus xylanilyticus TaxID=2944139 RepID=A0A9X2KX15_9GAMM|nr:glycosyltransferase family 2 protein [Gilvimarinus xylanilyticus]MCP8900270.1 glycosyltransferase family 2 protein [Gilvimarinus xylanilyticus]